MNYTVIVPFYNEEKNISSFNNELINNLKKINNGKRNLEIIYIDDGSKDETFNELKKLKTNAFETLIIKHRTNLSQSAAINSAISQSKYENIVIMDGDLQNDPNDLANMVSEFEKGTDMIIGWRKHRKDNFFFKKLPSAIANFIVRLFSKSKIHDHGCAFKILKKRKNIRLIDCNKFNLRNKKHYLFLGNAFLSQDSNNMFLNNKLKIVTRKKPSSSQLKSLKFAFNICKFVKSNAIVLANGKSTIGIGAGQPSRLDSCKIASQKALRFVPEKVMNSVAASDAFFPFSDGIEELAKAGVKAIIQPGGSINDKKVIKAANNAGLVMAFTGIRHFKH